MDNQCHKCAAELSPWEGESCISCVGTGWMQYFSNTERALYVLETEDGPLGVYDICRGIKREFGIEPSEPAIRASLSSDLRFCWAGKSMYGLYRHRLVPGPRNLAGVAKFLLYSAGAPINNHFLAFLMKFLGYRFNEQSLRSALYYDFDVTSIGRDGYLVGNSDEDARALNTLGFAPSMDDFHRLVDRWRRFIYEGLKEYGRRRSRD